MDVEDGGCLLHPQDLLQRNIETAMGASLRARRDVGDHHSSVSIFVLIIVILIHGHNLEVNFASLAQFLE